MSQENREQPDGNNDYVLDKLTLPDFSDDMVRTYAESRHTSVVLMQEYLWELILQDAMGRDSSPAEIIRNRLLDSYSKDPSTSEHMEVVRQIIEFKAAFALGREEPGDESKHD